MEKHRLAAYECRQYNIDLGWEISEKPYKVTDLFDELDEADGYLPTFKALLPSGVYEIRSESGVYNEDENLFEVNDFESLDIVDDSDSGYMYCAERYFGRHMIPLNKYRITYLFNSGQQMTRNQHLYKIEHRSFGWDAIEVFKTEEEATEWLQGTNVV